MTNLVITLTVAPENQVRLLELLRDSTEKVIRTLDGWVSTNLIASADGGRVVIHSQWRDTAAISAMQADPRMVAYYPRVGALASLESTIGEVVHTAKA